MSEILRFSYENQPAFIDGELVRAHIGIGAQVIYPSGPGVLLTVMHPDNDGVLQVVEVDLRPEVAEQMAAALLRQASDMRKAEGFRLVHAPEGDR